MLRKKYIVLLFSILLSLQAFSQVDSIMKSLVNAEDSEKANLYNQLAYYYMDSTGIAGINFANTAIKYAVQFNQSEEESYAYIMLGSCHIFKSDFQLALEAFLYAEKLALEINKPEHLQRIYTNIGIVYRYTDQLDLSIEYNSKALDQAIQSGELSGLIQTYISIGNAYAMQNNLSESLIYFEKAISAIEGKDTLLTSLAGLYNNVGYIKFKESKFNAAEESYLEAYSVFEQIQNFHGMGLCLNNIAQIHLISGEYEEAEKYITKADSLHKLNDFKESRKNLYYTAHELYYESGQYEKSIHYLKEYQTLKDSIHTEDLYKEIEELHTKYKVDSLNAETKAKENEITQSKKLNWILLFVVSLFITFLVVLIILFAQKKKLLNTTNIQNKLLKLKDKEIEDNLLYARKIQLANKSKLLKRNHITIFDKPKSIVGGDFYLLKEINDCTYIALGDATGHGVSGGFLSVISQQYLEAAFENFKKVSDVINYLNNKFYTFLTESDSLKGESLAISLLKVENNLVELTGSKQKVWIYDKEQNDLREHKTSALTIGRQKNQDYSITRIKVKQGDIIFLSSDGFPDQFGSGEKGKYKYKQFRDLLISCSISEFVEIPNTLEQELYDWKREVEQTDDILVIGFKI
jgi:serine phosphatase RsbU (regulator of sigma subunit)